MPPDQAGRHAARAAPTRCLTGTPPQHLHGVAAELAGRLAQGRGLGLLTVEQDQGRQAAHAVEGAAASRPSASTSAGWPGRRRCRSAPWPPGRARRRSPAPRRCRNRPRRRRRRPAPARPSQRRGGDPASEIAIQRLDPVRQGGAVADAGLVGRPDRAAGRRRRRAAGPGRPRRPRAGRVPARASTSPAPSKAKAAAAAIPATPRRHGPARPQAAAPPARPRPWRHTGRRGPAGSAASPAGGAHGIAGAAAPGRRRPASPRETPSALLTPPAAGRHATRLATG